MYNFFLTYLLNDNPDKVLSKIGIRIRRVVNPLIRKIAPATSKNKLIIVDERPLPEDTPLIFCPCHGFKDDVLFSIVTIGKPAYILFGSLPQFYHTMDGVIAWLNGVIMVDRTNKKSRHAAVAKMVQAIKWGANLMVFPEGVWNKTPNLLIQKLYAGVYMVAKETGAMIVPVSTHLDGKICYAMRGEAFDITQYDRESGITILRDKMATQKWLLMEKASIISRKTLLGNKSQAQYWNDYIEGLIAEVAYYDRKVEDHAQYRDKGEYDSEDIFSVCGIK